MSEEIPVSHCPVCGRYVSTETGWMDVEPGGIRGHDYNEMYCNRVCASRMDPPARCEVHGEPHCRDEECWDGDHGEVPAPPLPLVEEAR